MKTVLLTGSTGSLGKLLLRELHVRDDLRLILFVRGASDADARARIEQFIALPDRTEIYAADLHEPNLALSDQRYRDLAGRVTHILHSAASTRFNSSLEEARTNNVATTEHMLTFAKNCSSLARFGYLSTAMVAGKRMGLINEDELEHDKGFNNTYQQSKYEAEKLVHASGLPIVVLRPPLVYSPGEENMSGNLTNFLTRLVQLVVSGKIPFVPGTPESTMDIVSAADAARVICQIFVKEPLEHLTYHVTNGADCLTVDTFHKIMEEEKGSSIPIEYLGDGDEGMRRVHEKAQTNPEWKVVYQRTESFLSEPGYPKVFDNAHLLRELRISKLGENSADTLRLAVHNAIWPSST